MSTLAARRPARSTLPDSSPGPIDLVAPPQQGESAPMSGSMGMILLPAASGVGAVLLAVTQQDRPLMAAAGLLVLAASIAVGLAIVIGSRTGTRRQTREQRERYLDYLEQARSAAREGAGRQRRKAALFHPSPAAAASMAGQSDRRWERRPADVDFLVLRAGLGVVPLNRRVTLQVDANDPLAAHDPVCLAAAQELAATYATLTDQPICLPIDGAVLSVIGSADRARGIVRALLAQLVWSHSPSEVAVLVVTTDRTGIWEWVKWLPHNLSGQGWDGPLRARLITASPLQARELLTTEITEGAVNPMGVARRTVVVVDQIADRSQATADTAALCTAARAVGASQIHLVHDHRDEPDRVDIRLVAADSAAAGSAATGSAGAGGRQIGTPTAHAASRDPGCDPQDLDPRDLDPHRPDPYRLDAYRLDPRGPGTPDPGARDLVEFGTTRRSWCRLDDLDVAGALLLAKSFAPLRAGIQGQKQSGSGGHLVDPLRFGDVAAIDPVVSWRRRPASDLLRVPIGTTIDGTDLVLDLKESAQGGMGPHGLVVGATGSGKSELLRTLVTALAMGHPPEILALLLADFKGGATFSGLAPLPHVVGMITNLEADLSLVDRFRDALGGEVQRRQEKLAAAGKLTSLESYLELRRLRPELEAMPHLLVIVDEFSELLGARPDLVDLFVTIGRIGRSMGIHLLLATQRLDTGRIRGLESHLSYRICLRTFSESESREAIGTTDAYHLPAEPGWGYLRADSPEQRLFRAVTVSRPYRPPQSNPVSVGTPILPYDAHNGTAARIAALHESRLLATRSRLAAGTINVAEPAGDRRRGTVLDVAVDRLTALAPRLPQGHPARRVWLEPLPRRLNLADLLWRSDSPPDTRRPGHDWALAPPGSTTAPTQPGSTALPQTGSTIEPAPPRSTTAPTEPGRISAVLGVIDVPERQRQELLDWDFTDGNGNLLIVGAGRSGKSTAVRTLLVSLALRHSPVAVQVICVDFGGETLVPLGELPHVAAVATRSDPELTGRVFARIAGLLTEREALFRRHRFESTAALRRARTAGDLDPSVAGDVVLIFDGWSAVIEPGGVPEGALDEILRRGTGVGIHTVLTVGSPGQLRTRLIGGFGGRIELKLSDSFDSAIDRQMAKSLPADMPGRALVAGRHYAQIAAPFLCTEQVDPRRPPGEDRAAIGSSPGDSDIRLRSGMSRNLAGTGVLRHPAGSRNTVDTDIQLHSAEQVIAVVCAQWPGQSAPRIRTLPERISLTDLQAKVGDGGASPAVLLGLAEDGCGPVRHNFSGEDAHLVVYGDSRSGKTTVLRSLLTQLVGADSSSAAAERTGRPDVVMVDYRRGRSLGAGQNTPALTVATDPVHAAEACRSVEARLASRINEPVNARHRDDLSGDSRADDDRPVHQPEIYLMVDDYELVGATAVNPLQSLLPYLPHGRDIGFHLVLTRRTGGAARAQYETVLQCLGDLGTPVLMLSGSPTEGRLAHGLVPQSLPAGRARLATRGTEPQLIQTAWVVANCR